MQTSVVVLYTCNEHPKMGTKYNFIYNNIQKSKIPRNNVNQGDERFYTENYKLNRC